MENYSKILPCLQTVGPWWTVKDRLDLFCYLLKIFPFDKEFLSTTEAASYDSEINRISVTEIEAAYENFRYSKSASNCTCAAIRRYKFSFGGINPKICCLCPYSSTYRNYAYDDEKRFLIYLLIAKRLNLSFISDKLTTGNSEDFISFIPLYADKYLVDAYPITFYIDPILSIDNLDDLKGSGTLYDYVKGTALDNIHKKIPYIRLKDKLEIHFGDYHTLLIKTASVFFDELVLESKTIRPPAPQNIKALFGIIVDANSKGHRIDPHEYFKDEIIPVESGMFSQNIFYDVIPVDLTSINGISTLDESETSSNNSDDPLNTLLDTNYQELPSIDDPIIQQALNEGLPADGNIKVYTVSPREPEALSNAAVLPQVPPEELLAYQEYYTLTASEDIFIFGSEPSGNDDAILNAFVANSDFINMEPIFYPDKYGVLMINGAGDMLIYPIEIYKARRLRKIADSGIQIYTSSRYHLSLYLFRNKVFRFQIKDLGLAYTLSTGIDAKGISSFSTDGLLQTMKQYKNIYDTAISKLTTDQQATLIRLESFTALLCADGNIPPFSNLTRLSSGYSNSEFLYNYTEDCQPFQSGIFMEVKISYETSDTTSIDTKLLYMNAMIDLDRHIPFTEGSVHILKMNNNSILLYITGNIHNQDMMKLFVSSSIRRSCSSLLPSNELLNIEEKIYYKNIVENQNKRNTEVQNA